MGALATAGTAAAALIALGTLARWLIRRTVRAAAWTSAAIRLPAVVNDLAISVTDLAGSVADLSKSVDQLHHHREESVFADHL